MFENSLNEIALELHRALTAYIEATYHISDADLLQQRSQSLACPGVIHQIPYLESTPRYATRRTFSEIPGLHPAAAEALQALVPKNQFGKSVLFDPPYVHQAQALEDASVHGKNLLIMTGTGSGKTESFLMPVLASLAQEAHDSPETFSKTAVRAMVLYPMNALVNDQLSRLRAILGDQRIVSLFTQWASRPPRFARYTSRTPYAGQRDKEKDKTNLKQIGDFYIRKLEAATAGDEESARLVSNLKSRYKWPAKPDLRAWYGNPSGHWLDKNGEFRRAIMLPGDSELITRHEVQLAPPDVLVSNYSMLEYMLMRPVERNIFDQTAAWLKASKGNHFTLILDEAHLYRGAPGTEVALLVRRLRDRLGVDNGQFRVICSTASFSDPVNASKFVAELTGTEESEIRVVEGEYSFRASAGPGTSDDAALLAGIDLTSFRSDDENVRERSVAAFLASRDISGTEPLYVRLHRALESFAPLGLLVNRTMRTAQAVAELPAQIFPGTEEEMASRALLALTALASAAKPDAESSSLLPARVHSFFRGLQGLWVCMDPECSGAPHPGQGHAGRLYTQPRDRCESCHSLVLELFTCRYCGTAYGRGYTPTPANPDAIWTQPGARLDFHNDSVAELRPLDLMLSEAADGLGHAACLDLITGQIDDANPTARRRVVYLPPLPTSKTKKADEDDATATGTPGLFSSCGCCGQRSHRSGSPVQDHETKGDQPLQVLVGRQIQLQPPSPAPATALAPLRGRKVLIFSDSRQVAARLAPNLQQFSARDSVRAAVAVGWQKLAESSDAFHLGDLVSAALVGAMFLDVRLRPEWTAFESFEIYNRVGQAFRDGELADAAGIVQIVSEIREAEIPRSLLADIIQAVRDPLVGLEALAIGSIVERKSKRAPVIALPALPGVAETPDHKLQLARAWLREWRRDGFHLKDMPPEWVQKEDAEVRVRSRGGAFKAFVASLPEPARARFKSDWLPRLREIFTVPIGTKFRLQGASLALDLQGEWVRCLVCTVPQRPCHGLTSCAECGRGPLVPLNPDTDPYFVMRKGFYRAPVAAALRGEGYPPVAIVAAEHTAQLNAAQHEDVFSKGEINELLFQDVNVPNPSGRPYPAVDVLSSTTTMEVGIDIGQLSGVALRNMPPTRANYQQRAGRAGRRANAVASVLAYAGSDTHDEHFFSEPGAMITGKVVDPKLSLENRAIVERHLRAFLLQAYLQSKTTLMPGTGTAQLFSVLGRVRDFLDATQPINRPDFVAFLSTNESALRKRAESILPIQLEPSDRAQLLDEMATEVVNAIDAALSDVIATPSPGEWIPDFGPQADVAAEPDEARPVGVNSASMFLLDRLLYKGVLPRYAFPTDVATFHVFNPTDSTEYRPRFEYLPAQGMSVALSQYAPGKDLWVDGKLYHSGAIYSPILKERSEAWREKALHAVCSRCGHSDRWHGDEKGELGARRDCEACHGQQSLGPARHWIKPVGFAHPIDHEVLTRADDFAPPSYATRAQLTLKSSEGEEWVAANPRVRVLPVRTTLLVSNTGPASDGFDYCTTCGRIESAKAPNSELHGPHLRPYPAPEKQTCVGSKVAKHIVLGTDFISDVALFSLRLGQGIRLLPAASITPVALRTVSEAIARAATETVLQIEYGEVVAEFRPALTDAGVRGEQAEIFLYDTLPGGAGYSQRAVEDTLLLLKTARQAMECKANCDSSCYRCLRTFRNRPDHALIDRHIGISLVDYLLSGQVQAFSSARLNTAVGLLLLDLERLPVDHSYTLDPTTPGRLFAKGKRGTKAISIGHPLTVAETHEFMSSKDGDELVLNEMLVRQHVADASTVVRNWLTLGS